MANEETDLTELRDAFACFDKDGSGTITADEIGQVLTAMNRNFTRSQLQQIVTACDDNGDGQIDFQEFLHMMRRQTKVDPDQELKDAFAVFDKDHDGTITATEIEIIMDALGEDIDREMIDLMIKSVDTDGNGTIDFNEFRKMMQDGPLPTTS